MSNGLEYLVGQFNFPCTFIFLPGVAVQTAEKALALYKPCSRITKTSLRYQPCVRQKPNPQPHSSHYEENSLYPSRNKHTPAHLKPSTTEAGCWAMHWAALCPFTVKFQRAKPPLPTFPPQEAGSLVLFLWWATPRPQLAGASPACAPFQRGTVPAEQHPTPFCCSSQQCCLLLHGLDNLTAQRDPARPAGNTVLRNIGRAVLENSAFSSPP